MNMKYTVYEVTSIMKNSYGDYANVLEPPYFTENKFDNKGDALELVKKLKAEKFSYERHFVILEVY